MNVSCKFLVFWELESPLVAPFSLNAYLLLIKPPQSGNQRLSIFFHIRGLAINNTEFARPHILVLLSFVYVSMGTQWRSIICKSLRNHLKAEPAVSILSIKLCDINKFLAVVCSIAQKIGSRFLTVLPLTHID